MMLDGVQLSGLKTVKCSDCPKSFLVLIESTRTRCLACDYLHRRARESKKWHRDKRKAVA